MHGSHPNKKISVKQIFYQMIVNMHPESCICLSSSREPRNMSNLWFWIGMVQYSAVTWRSEVGQKFGTLTLSRDDDDIDIFKVKTSDFLFLALLYSCTSSVIELLSYFGECRPSWADSSRTNSLTMTLTFFFCSATFCFPFERRG
jgi:hypothetical protein